MTPHALRLMYREAIERFDDVQALRTIRLSSNGSHLFELLAFELLLKFVHNTAVPESGLARGHRYHEIFAALPQELQVDLLRVAGERIGPSDLRDHVPVLADWSHNFVALRYPYEKYLNDTAEAYLKRGDEWHAAGSQLETADFRFHPEELLGMLHALRGEAERRFAELPPG